MNKFKDNLRSNFPTLKKKIYKKPLIYLDNAATTLTPLSVIHAVREYYTEYSSNISRGSYHISSFISELYELTREKVSAFINAKNKNSIIFTKGSTESINIVADACILHYIKEHDEILITIMEHHSNFIPWQDICKKTGSLLKFIHLNNIGEIDFEDFIFKITKKTKFIALTHISNILGIINPIKSIISYAHKKKIIVLIDGAQAIPHIKVDVALIKPDFYIFSGHKMYAPTGIGILYIRHELLSYTKVYQKGGGIINFVNIYKTQYKCFPQKLESGTPNISGILGLGAAIEYIKTINIQNISKMEKEITMYAENTLRTIPRIHIIGTSKKRTGIISFIIKGIHSHDISTMLDLEGIAVRSGFSCAEPLLKYLNINSVTRVSLSFYNTIEEINILHNALEKLIWILRK